MSLDNALLLLIAVVVFAKAILIRRETTFGRSMATFNAVLGCLFLYGGLRQEWPALNHRDVVIALRLGLLFSALWVLSELIRIARGRWRLVRSH